MAEKEEVTVERSLLQENLSIMHSVYMKSIDELHSRLLVDAVSDAVNGKEFNPSGISFKIKELDCQKDDNKKKSKSPRIKVEDMSTEFIESLLDVVEGTVKNKKPSMENLEELVASLDELFKKKR